MATKDPPGRDCPGWLPVAILLTFLALLSHLRIMFAYVRTGQEPE